jgi:hypothetical protein
MSALPPKADISEPQQVVVFFRPIDEATSDPQSAPGQRNFTNRTAVGAIEGLAVLLP